MLLISYSFITTIACLVMTWLCFLPVIEPHTLADLIILCPLTVLLVSNIVHIVLNLLLLICAKICQIIILDFTTIPSQLTIKLTVFAKNIGKGLGEWVVNMLGWVLVSIPVVIIFGMMPIVLFGMVVLIPFYFAFSYLEPLGDVTNVALILYIIIKRSKYLTEILNKPQSIVQGIEKKWELALATAISYILVKLFYKGPKNYTNNGIHGVKV